MKSSGARFVLLASLVLASVAASADPIQPFKTQTISSSGIIDTRQFFPQFNHVVGPMRSRAENEDVYFEPGVPNDLPVGKVFALDRGKPASKFPGISFTGMWPPDCDMGVGPQHVVVVVNTSVAFYSKGGTVVLEQPLDTFFSAQIGTGSAFIFDPKVFYDPLSKRFFLTILDAAPDSANSTRSRSYIAVSDDSNPEGVWFKYTVDNRVNIGGKNFWFDYPGWAFTKDAIASSGNLFGFGDFVNGGSTLFTMDKAPMLNGGATTTKYFTLTDDFTVQLARTYDATQSAFYAVSSYNGSTLRLHAITGLPLNPTILFKDLTVPDFGYVPFAESTNGQQIDTVGFRMLNTVYRDGSIVSAHSIDPGTGRATVRWYEIKPNGWPANAAATPEVAQVGDIEGGVGQSTFMPAVTINKAGDIGVVFTKSSVADLMFASRKKTDAVGAMGTPKLVKRSPGPFYPLQRWGDYFGIDVDPEDNLSFWLFGMLGSDGNTAPLWTTEVAKFVVTEGGSFGTKLLPGSVRMVEGTSYTGGLAHIIGSDNTYFNVNSKALDRLGHVASVETGFSSPLAAEQIKAVTINLEAKAASNVSGVLFLYDWIQKKYVNVGSVPLSGIEALKSFKVPTSSWSRYVDSTKKLKMVVRAVMPNSLYRTAYPFTLKLDTTYLSVE